jgi:hypothetical protein
MSTTANLQTKALTVKQAAALMNVSERTIYTARKVLRLRPDLARECEAGRMSLHEAHRIACCKPKATSWTRLVSAWNNATDDDRDLLVFKILKAERSAP